MHQAPAPFEIALNPYLDLGHNAWTQDIKFGRNAAVGTAAFEPIWSNSGAYTPLTAAASLELVSDSAQDATGGTGATRIAVTYIDANMDEQTAYVTPNGTTAVDIASGYACNRAFAVSAGSSNSNVGNITIRVKTAGTVVAHIPAGEGQTLQAIVRVPRNHICIVDGYRISIDATQVVNFRGRVRLGVNPETGLSLSGGLGPARTAVYHDGITGQYSVSPRNWRVMPEGSLLWGEAQATVGSAVVSCDFDYFFLRIK